MGKQTYRFVSVTFIVNEISKVIERCVEASSRDENSDQLKKLVSYKRWTTACKFLQQNYYYVFCLKGKIRRLDTLFRSVSRHCYPKSVLNRYAKSRVLRKFRERRTSEAAWPHTNDKCQLLCCYLSWQRQLITIHVTFLSGRRLFALVASLVTYLLLLSKFAAHFLLSLKCSLQFVTLHKQIQISKIYVTGVFSQKFPQKQLFSE